MNKYLLIFILVIALLILNAGTYQYKKIGDNFTEENVVFDIIDIGNNDIYLFVNKEPGRVFLNQTKLVNGVNITVDEIFFHSDSGSRLVSLTLDVAFKVECTTNYECDDEDACTIDRCTGTPGRCDNDDSHVKVKVCRNNDGCCPLRCNFYNDNDCNLCNTNDDCKEDRDPCTNVQCLNEQCVFNETTQCVSGDDCCPEGCYYSIGSDTDCSKENKCTFNANCVSDDPCKVGFCRENKYTGIKDCVFEPVEACVSNDNCCPSNCDFINDDDCKFTGLPSSCTVLKDCLDNNVCTSDSCVNGKCVNILKGCSIGETCYDFKDVKDNFYCTEQGWVDQKQVKEKCEENYECLSNNCSFGRCKNKSKVWQSILDFLKKLV